MYFVDSDVFIDAKNRHYGFDFVPAFWDWLQREHQAGKVFTVQKVADEIIAGGDELSTWMHNQPASFRLAPGQKDQASLAQVSNWAVASVHYTQAAVSTFLAAGDYFLVAQALSLGFTVVTQETPDPVSKKRVKIPDACNAVGVKWINPFKMLSAENARFRL